MHFQPQPKRNPKRNSKWATGVAAVGLELFEFIQSARIFTEPLPQMITESVVASAFYDRSSIFSYDSKSIYVSTEDSISQYSSSTGCLVRSLTDELSQERINCVSLLLETAQDDASILCGVSTKGVLYRWHAPTGSLVNKVSLLSDLWREAVVLAAASNGKRNRWFLMMAFEEDFLLAEFNTDKSSLRILHKQSEQICCKKILFSDQFNCLMWAGGKTIFMYDLAREVVASHAHSSQVTCLDADFINRGSFCFGDSIGRLHIAPIGSLRSSSVSTTKETLHWHSTQVLCCMFTGRGAYLISGGEEAVIVVWQLGTDFRQFIPRLDAPILSCSQTFDERIAAFLQKNNSIDIFSTASMLRLQKIHGIACLGMRKRDIPTFKMQFQPATKYLTLPNGPGSLQVFSLDSNGHVYNQDITGKNTLFGKEGSGPNEVFVVHVAYSDDAALLATVEQQRLNRKVVSRMRLWSKKEDAFRYTCDTVIENVHLGSVFFASFVPNATAIVTGGEDGLIKLWEKTKSWSCVCSSSFKGKTPRSVAFTSDSSLLAVSFDGDVTIWSLFALELLFAYSPPVVKEKRGERALVLAFVPGIPFLVIGAGCKVYVFNLLSLTIWWQTEIRRPVKAIFPLCDGSDRFAVQSCSTRSLELFWFTLRSKKIQSQDASPGFPYQVALVKSDPGGSATFVACMEQNSANSFRIVTCATSKTAKPEDGTLKTAVSTADTERDKQSLTIYQSIFGEPALVKTKNVFHAAINGTCLNLGELSTLALPPMDHLADAFFRSLLPSKV